MISNIEKYKNDLDRLISSGDLLFNSIYYEYYPEMFDQQIRKSIKDEAKIEELKKSFISFLDNYQSWYSESLGIIKFLLPDRLNDFVKLYEKPKSRKSIEYGNYVIEDLLQDLVVTFSDGKRKVGPEAAVHQFQQQLNIVKSAQRRFESSLFDIKQLIRADLFDSELDAAKELNKKGFMRGGGAVAGVVLEAHLLQVCENHNIKITKGNPAISDLNDLLKKNDIIEVSNWRFIQHLGDIRNKCDHKKNADPTKQEIKDLIEGVEKIIKSIF
ncbi:MAG: hypothetical protein WCQ96_02580 [Patescibacteria group bacterium]